MIQAVVIAVALVIVYIIRAYLNRHNDARLRDLITMNVALYENWIVDSDSIKILNKTSRKVTAEIPWQSSDKSMSGVATRTFNIGVPCSADDKKCLFD